MEEGNKVFSSVAYLYMYAVEVRFDYFMESQVFETAITQIQRSLKYFIIMELSIIQWERAKKRTLHIADWFGFNYI